MVDLKRAGERLQSARLWIAHAQEAFDKKKDIRGELDLLIAQAELRRVREANSSCKWYKYSLFRQLAAFCLAVLMATAGIGGAYWMMNRGGQSKTMPQVMVYHDVSDNQAGQSQPMEAEKPIKSTTEQPLTLPAAAVQPADHQTVSREDHKAAPAASHDEKAKEKSLQDNVVSPDEMQKLIRTAGKSLRGQ